MIFSITFQLLFPLDYRFVWRESSFLVSRLWFSLLIFFSYLIFLWRLYHHRYRNRISLSRGWWNLLDFSFINDLLKFFCSLWAQVRHDRCKKLFRNLDSFIICVLHLALTGTYLLLLLPNHMILYISSIIASQMSRDLFCFCPLNCWLSWNLMYFFLSKRWKRRRFKFCELLWWWLLKIVKFDACIFLYLFLHRDFFILRHFISIFLWCFLCILFEWIWAFSLVPICKMILDISLFCYSSWIEKVDMRLSFPVHLIYLNSILTLLAWISLRRSRLVKRKRWFFGLLF